jgi:hypothetical protein
MTVKVTGPHVVFCPNKIFLLCSVALKVCWPTVGVKGKKSAAGKDERDTIFHYNANSSVVDNASTLREPTKARTIRCSRTNRRIKHNGEILLQSLAGQKVGALVERDPVPVCAARLTIPTVLELVLTN